MTRAETTDMDRRRGLRWSGPGVLLLAWLAVACGPAVKSPTPLEALPSPPLLSLREPPEYRIRPGDVLEIKCFYAPEMNAEALVRPDGRISVQMVREIVAAGRTAPDVAAELKALLTPVLATPEVAVIVRTVGPQVVYVGGQVSKPQLVMLASRTTVLQAVAQAGGFLDTARMEEVVLIRRGQDDRPVTVPLNLEAALDGQDPAQDVVLARDDIVYVPKSKIANVDQWVDQYIRKVLPMSSGFTLGYRLDGSN